MESAQLVQLITTLRTQVEELAAQLDRSRQETVDLRNATDHAIAALQKQCDDVKISSKVEAVEHDYATCPRESQPPTCILWQQEGGAWLG